MSRCPKCGSARVRPVIYESSRETWRPKRLMAVVSLTERRTDEISPNWECDTCAHTWPDLERVRAYRELTRSHPADSQAL